MSFLFNLLKVFIPFIFYSAFKGVIALRQLLKMANASSLSLSAFFSRLDRGSKVLGGSGGSGGHLLAALTFTAIRFSRYLMIMAN